jgi:GAF domain-containing protein
VTQLHPSLPAIKKLVSGGLVREALALLNSMTAHRFTALYRFDRETLRNMYFFDRENPTVETTDAIPVMASYCVYVRETNRAFETTHAREDDRVRDHPKREVLQAYCGVPRLDEGGLSFGSVCHFDFAPRAISAENLALMEAFAGLIQPGR